MQHPLSGHLGELSAKRVQAMVGGGAENTSESKEDFIRRNFTYKECQIFIPRETEDGSVLKCGCGEMELHHFDEETDYFPEEWMPYLIASMGSTNAYGVVDFYTGIQNLHKSSEYVRVSDDDNPESVIELMLKHWKLLEADPPLLCISVLGGLDSANCDSKKKDVFCEGLINIVSATNAWITTFGLNCGVARVVSDAISLAETYFIKENGESPKVTCIGVSPWGDVRSHYNLVKSVYSKPHAHIIYGVSNVVNPNEAISLNKNHTHYILVDNGMRNSYQRSNIFQYRDKIDELIATPLNSGGCGVPVVTLVLGGGFDVIENVAKRASQGMPIIICGSTGGAAEILHRISQYNANKKSQNLSATQINELKELLTDLLESCQDSLNPDWTVEKGIELLQTIAANERFLSYFALGVESRIESLDKIFVTLPSNLVVLT
nr:transient receptor potential cation channel [Hymenolepis microstoma]